MIKGKAWVAKNYVMSYEMVTQPFWTSPIDPKENAKWIMAGVDEAFNKENGFVDCGYTFIVAGHNFAGGGNYSLDLKGKQLPGIPSFIWNTNINYLVKHFGADLSSNFNGNRYVDPTNIIKYNNLKIINAGAFARFYPKGKITSEIRVGIQAKNVFNNSDIQNIAGLGASELALGQKQRTPDFKSTQTASLGTPVWGQGYVQLPRRFLVTLSFDF